MNKDTVLYSVAVGEKRPGESHVYRHPDYVEKLKPIPEGFSSLTDLWEESLKKFNDKPLLQNVTYEKANELQRRIGSYIQAHNHKTFYMYVKNCINWTLIDIATWNYGFVIIPLYDTLGEEALHHIVLITEGSLMFSSRASLGMIIKMVKSKKHCLKEICFWEKMEKEEVSELVDAGIKISCIEDLLCYDKIEEKPKIDLNDHYSYCFTSGTTGIPKGVVYKHRNLLAELFAVDEILTFLDTDEHMSFLPIAHAFERVVSWICIMKGTHINYIRYPITEFPKNLAEIRPTILTMVPRLLNRFYPLVKGIYEKEGNFEKIKALFGGRVRLIMIGSAPVSPQILKFFKEALGCIVQQGYGMTETTAGTFMMRKDDTEYGSVGGPIGSIEFKLIDVPQMNYLTNDSPPQGEVCFRGQPIFDEYYKNPEATNETIDSDGWTHAGDIGIILPNGSLKIVDRKKNIFKLQHGEYIAPEKIQNIYARCKFVGQSFVYGDSLEDHLIAFVSPNMEALPLVAQKIGIQEKDPVKLCENPTINGFILKEMTEQGVKDGLKGFEQAKKIKLIPKPFALLGIVTSTMKLQRFQAQKLFQEEIKQMYSK